LQDGACESIANGQFFVDGSEYAAEWRIVTSAAGAVEALSVQWADDAGDVIGRFAEGTVRTALANALSDKRQSFLQRRIASYVGPALSGEYWLPGFRFAPVIPRDDQPYRIDLERVVTLDFTVHAIDGHQAHALGQALEVEYMENLSLLLDRLFEPIPHEEVWVVPNADGVPRDTSERRSRGFFHPLRVLSSMPRKRELCDLGLFTGSVAEVYRLTAADLLTLPTETRSLLRVSSNGLTPHGRAIQACARMYRLSLVLRRYSPSAAIAYQVAAVDAIVSATKPSFTSVSDFVRRYCPEAEITDAFLDYLYGPVRSGHFHAGSAPLDNYGQMFFYPLMEPATARSSLMSINAGIVLRRAIGRWLRECAANGADDSAPDA
jgi:hypothetical protein